MTACLRRRGRGVALMTSLGLAMNLSAPLAARPLTESEAISSALEQGDFAALGEGERAAAEARVRAIPRLDNPEANISRESVSGPAGNETEWQAGVTQPLDISGRRSSLRRAAQAEAEAVSADVARRRQQRIAEVREAYAGCAAASEKVAIAERYSARLREAERIVTLRTRAGDTAGYDLRRLRVEARSAEAELRIARGESAAECSALAGLTGIVDARPAVPLARLVPAFPASAARAAAASRQDILARQARAAAAEAEARAARQARIPDLSVGLGYKRLSNEAGSAGGPVAAVGVRIPLFSSGRAAADEARARQRVREAELALARREAEASIAVAAARASAAVSAAGEARQAADDAARLSTIAETAYQGGETGVIELIDAYRTGRDAELDIVELTERAVRATIAQSLAEGRE